MICAKSLQSIGGKANLYFNRLFFRFNPMENQTINSIKKLISKSTLRNIQDTHQKEYLNKINYY